MLDISKFLCVENEHDADELYSFEVTENIPFFLPEKYLQKSVFIKIISMMTYEETRFVFTWQM